MEKFYFTLAENFIQTSKSIESMLLSIILSFFFGLAIMFVHRKNSSTIVYDSQINFSLLLITIIVTVVMIVIGSNLALSLGLIGALSIIRFRTAIKNTIDISFIFWAIATGLVLGSYNYLLAIVEIGLISGIIFLSSKFLILKKQSNDYIIVLLIDKKSQDTSNIQEKIEKISKKYEIKSFIEMDEYNELSIYVSLKENQISNLLKELKPINNIKKTSVLYPNTNLYI
jgi:uncharacterized membrane protein YhiD involved in acid resistance